MIMGTLFILLAATQGSVALGAIRWGETVLRQKSQWYDSTEARAVADNVIQYQSPQGGWPKSTDLAKPPLWARFYELGTNRPLCVDRDSVFRYDYAEISYESRSGYSYHGTWAASLLSTGYPAWRRKHKLP